MAGTILLKNGMLLLHSDDNKTINTVISDLLIRGDRIEAIEKDIVPEEGTTVIDCTDKIISPGFVDTHRHMWHTQVKGYADVMLYEYLIANFVEGALYTPSDVFWGQLAGCLEAIDAGTTTVVDHSHINHSPEHAPSAISATLTSGIRSFYCYCPNPQVTNWTPYTLDTNPPPWFFTQLQTISELAKKTGHTRVLPGLAFDGMAAPKEAVTGIITTARNLGLRIITSHHTHLSDSIRILSDYSLLSSDMIFSHACAISEQETALLKAKGGYISSTPSTELQMGMSSPVCTRPELRDHSSLGVDCHSTSSADLFGQMRLVLQSARNTYSEKLGHIPSVTNITALEIFNMGTIGGARAVGMEHEIGSLKIGKKADVVVFDGMSPGMVCGSPKDPLGAIVLHASVRDVETVIIDGVVRKKGGRLVPCQLEPFEGMGKGVNVEGEIEWKKVAREVVDSRARIDEKVKGIDYEAAKQNIWKFFGL